MTYIKDYKEGDVLRGVYLCKSKQSLKAKTGKTYYSMILQDKTGNLDTKIWDVNSNGIESFDSMEYVYCEGDITSFQGKLQGRVDRLRRAQEGEYDPREFVPVSEKSVERMYEELLEIVDSVEFQPYHKILNYFFRENEEIVAQFRSHSAAKTVHHGFMGGLLEHTLSVTKICRFYTELYPILQYDLLITAALLHDIGKIWELSDFPRNDYTDGGQLLGHIYIGASKIEQVADQIPDLPRKKRDELLHCILAHHGKLEFGSPKVPSLIEARALNLADDTDAKLETFAETLMKEEGRKDWFGFQKYLDSTVRWTSNPPH